MLILYYGLKAHLAAQWEKVYYRWLFYLLLCTRGNGIRLFYKLKMKIFHASTARRIDNWLDNLSVVRHHMICIPNRIGKSLSTFRATWASRDLIWNAIYYYLRTVYTVYDARHRRFLARIMHYPRMGHRRRGAEITTYIPRRKLESTSKFIEISL